MIRQTLTLLVFLLACSLAAQTTDADILEFARVANRENRVEEAIKFLEIEINKDDAHQPAYLLAQGLCFWNIANYAEAKGNLELVFATEKTNSALVNSDAYWLLGNICEVEHRPEEEILAYKKALVYRPGHPEISVTLALALIETDKNEEGLAILDWMLEEGYEHSFIYNNRALGLLKIGRLAAAKENLDIAQKLDPDNPFVDFNYFLYYQEKGDDNRACKYLAAALEKDVLAYGLEDDLRSFRSLQAEHCNN